MGRNGTPTHGGDATDVIATVDQLAALYDAPIPVALTKELDRITEHYRAYIEAAPFMVLATSGPEGLDCSPRGDGPGFVRVADERTLLVPDRRGNNRLDSLRNIVVDPRVALLFLIPGIDITLRVNGRARVRTDASLRESFAVGGKVPVSVIEVMAERVYVQCPKALVRSRLWDAGSHRRADELPTMGEMMSAITAGAIDGDQYDAAYSARMRDTLY